MSEEEKLIDFLKEVEKIISHAMTDNLSHIHALAMIQKRTLDFRASKEGLKK